MSIDIPAIKKSLYLPGNNIGARANLIILIYIKIIKVPLLLRNLKVLISQL